MSAPLDPFDELRAILEALCEDRLTSAQAARLEELTLHDAAARRFYLEYIDLHGNLYWDAAQGRPAEVELAIVEDNLADPTLRRRESRGRRFASPSGDRRPKQRRRAQYGLAAAIGAAMGLLLLVASWSALTMRERNEPFNESAAKARGAAAHTVDTTTDSRNEIDAGPLDRSEAVVHAPRVRPQSPHPPLARKPQTPLAAQTASAQLIPMRPGIRGGSTDLRPGTSARKKVLAEPAVSRRLVPIETEAPRKSRIVSPLAPSSSPPEGAATPAATTIPSALDEDEAEPMTLGAFIDSRIRRGWTSAGVEPSPIAADGEWLRRVYLDIVGHIPPEEAVDAFLEDDSAQKRAAVVDQLLKDPGFPRNWATVWTNLLIGRRPPARGIRRESFERFLRDSFAANVGWNEIVYELISAEGDAEQNPAATFLLANLNNDAVPATALTARVFLGIQVQCTQCHDHPFYKDKQDRFWQLKSFFQQTEMVSHASLPDGAAASTSTDVASASSDRQMAALGEGLSRAELATRPVGGPIYYETLRGEMRAAYPVYAGQKIDPGPKINRRRELARLIAKGDDRQLALAMVNRAWQHFFGSGFTRPVDDMGAHNPPTHPEVLNRLAKEFAASGYDLKRLIRWICATDAYQRASTLERTNESDDPSTGTTPAFSRVYLKPMAAEQLYDSLLVATRAKASAHTDWNDVGRRRQDWVKQFVISYGTDENDETTTLAGSVSQALLMMNDAIVQKALAIEPGTLLYDVAHDSANDAAKIRRLCRSALSRDPTSAELKAALRHLRAQRSAVEAPEERPHAEGQALQDVLWAYLNANEFALVH